MVPESGERTRVEFSSQAQSPPQRALHPSEYGESPGWGVQHQRDGLATWAQERLGLLRIAGRRSGVELRFHTPGLHTSASKTGMAHQTPSAGGLADRYSYSPLLIRNQSLPLWWKEHVPSVFQPSKATTVA